jgi:hypothetical protein
MGAVPPSADELATSYAAADRDPGQELTVRPGTSIALLALLAIILIATIVQLTSAGAL